jgi:dihydrofolate reductase
MKVMLYMATTVNGYIAKENDETPWSNEEWMSYSKFAKDVGNLVIGKRTYEIMEKDNTFAEMGSPFTVVVTSEDFAHNSNFALAKSPKEALKILEGRGFAKALIGGGGILNASFMKENLVDEVYLDIEPMVFGKGIKLFSGEDFDTKLEFIEMKKLSKNVIQLHYKIKK